jgi:hypothetical protein
MSETIELGAASEHGAASPIAAISRVAPGPDHLNGEPVRRGSLIVISPYVLHRHRLLWNCSDAFDPQGFLGAARAGIDRFAYLPFGTGHAPASDRLLRCRKQRSRLRWSSNISFFSSSQAMRCGRCFGLHCDRRTACRW